VTYYAHSANSTGAWHLLRLHLASVGRLAATFARGETSVDEAELAGVLHDLGKYGDRFQARLRGDAQGIDHWSQGAWLALKDHRAVAAALAIQGHHIGLQSGSSDALKGLSPDFLIRSHPLRLEPSDPDPERLARRATDDGLTMDRSIRPTLCLPDGWRHAVAAMLDVRMLFSCLVDADFLDTEAHFAGDAAGKRPRGEAPRLDAAAALAVLQRHVASLRAATRAHAAVRRARDTLWEAALRASRGQPGLFTLTAPTGSGKTLAMLRFALAHAMHNGLRRVVVAVPFLTVIEQTAEVYRALFEQLSEHFVLEHHSLAGFGAESARGDAEEDQVNHSERRRRLLAENWDAPIVLTTNVQLLESLFSNRSSTCRKLHNLAESVIVFDEAQTLPGRLAVPTLAALSRLAAAYRSTVVFATATQPAFECLESAVAKHAGSGWRPTEVVPDHGTLFAALARVSVRWPQHRARRGWADLADELRALDQVLVIVNLKRHARALFDALDGTSGLYHLSTNLCPAHRRAVLVAVRARLDRGEPCRLISTQCVEAGVDVDFPCVYRALAPLDAIAQAAGRCNREGRMPALGEVLVFEPEEGGDWRRIHPTHAYFRATEMTRTMLLERGSIDVSDPHAFREYYRRLYDPSRPVSGDTMLGDAIQARDFVEVARRYRLIDDDAIQVLVPWKADRSRFKRLRDEAERDGIASGWTRRAQSLAVSVYRPRDGLPPWAIPLPLARRGSLAPAWSDEWFALEGDYYNDVLGLDPPAGHQVFIA